MTYALTRLPDWRSRMHTNLDKVKVTPFGWGKNDCATLLTSHVFSLTGQDILKDYPQNYDSLEGALEAIKEYGYADFNEMVAANFAEIPTNHVHAQVGDLAMIQTDPTKGDGVGWGIGVFLGGHVGVLTPKGYGYLPRSFSKITHSYKVG